MSLGKLLSMHDLARHKKLVDNSCWGIEKAILSATNGFSVRCEHDIVYTQVHSALKNTVA